MNNFYTTTVPAQHNSKAHRRGIIFPAPFAGLTIMIVLALSFTGCQSAQLQQAFNSRSSENLAEQNKQPEKTRTSDNREKKPAGKDDSKKESLVSLIGGSKSEKSAKKESAKQHIKEDMAQGLRAASEARYDVARIHFLRVLQAEPSNAEAHHHMAMVADQQQDFNAAEDHYRQALNQNPKDPKLLSDIGWSLILQKRYQDSEKYLQEALKHDPRNKMALDRMGYLAAQLKDYDKALAMFRMSGTEQEAQANMAELFPQGRPLSSQSVAQNSPVFNQPGSRPSQNVPHGFNPALQNSNIQTVQHTQPNMPTINSQPVPAANNQSPFYGQNAAGNSFNQHVPAQQLSAPTPWANNPQQPLQQTGVSGNNFSQHTTPHLPSQQAAHSPTPQAFGQPSSHQSTPATPYYGTQQIAVQQDPGHALGGYAPPPFSTTQPQGTSGGITQVQQGQSPNPVINPGFTQPMQTPSATGNHADPLDSMPAWPFAKGSQQNMPAETAGQTAPNWPGNQAANPNYPAHPAHTQQTQQTGVQQTGFSQTPPDWPGNQSQFNNPSAIPAGQQNGVMHAHGVQQNAQKQAAYQGMNVGPGQMFPVVNAAGQTGIQQTSATQFPGTQSVPTITPGKSASQTNWPQEINRNQFNGSNGQHNNQPPENWNRFPNTQQNSGGYSGQTPQSYPQQGFSQSTYPQTGANTTNPYRNYSPQGP